MSEIMISTGHPDAGRIYAEALHRVTAERDSLQALLTAADERADVLVTALAGMLFAFDDGAGREWSEDLLDFARKLTAAKEFKSALKPAEGAADSCEFCKGWGFRGNPETGTDEGCGACAGTGKEPSDDQP